MHITWQAIVFSRFGACIVADNIISVENIFYTKFQLAATFFTLRFRIAVIDTQRIGIFTASFLVIGNFHT